MKTRFLLPVIVFALWFAVAPGLALQAFVNWDLLAVALSAGATLAFVRRREPRGPVDQAAQGQRKHQGGRRRQDQEHGSQQDLGAVGAKKRG